MDISSHSSCSWPITLPEDRWEPSSHHHFQEQAVLVPRFYLVRQFLLLWILHDHPFTPEIPETGEVLPDVGRRVYDRRSCHLGVAHDSLLFRIRRAALC